MIKKLILLLALIHSIAFGDNLIDNLRLGGTFNGTPSGGTVNLNSVEFSAKPNGLTITSSTGTLTIGSGKTATISNTLTLAGTDGSTLNIGTGGTLGTSAYTAANSYATLAGNNSFVLPNSSPLFRVSTQHYTSGLLVINDGQVKLGDSNGDVHGISVVIDDTSQLVAVQTGGFSVFGSNYSDGLFGTNDGNGFVYVGDSASDHNGTLIVIDDGDTEQMQFTALGGFVFNGTIFASGSISVATHTPSSASDTGVAGTITWDANFIYVCVATNTWKRIAILTW